MSYAELLDKAAGIAATLRNCCEIQEPKLSAILGYRSPTAYASMIAVSMVGYGYVPLNIKFPAESNRYMLVDSGAHSVIVDDASSSQLDDLLSLVERPLVVILPDHGSSASFHHRHPNHKFVYKEMFPRSFGVLEATVSPEDYAYVLFTSGSTGRPKGVVVTQSNVRHYIDFITNYLAIDEYDRISQNSELTFDVSVFDLWGAWERGACACAPTRRQIIKPGDYIRDSRLTIWSSAPSAAVNARKLGMLKPGMYPNLRASVFAGEAFPIDLARAWQSAAHNSTVGNHYGPTELTVTCTYYKWDDERTPREAELGIVPIGECNPGMEALIVGEDLNEVESGDAGELLMTGPQMAAGYWKQPEKTRFAFVVPPGKDRVYYRTGDRVRRARGKPLGYLGRVDHQIKIFGIRIEPGEVEAAVREVTGIDAVVAVGWPKTPTGADGIEVFIETVKLDTAQLTKALAARLPTYMIPKHFHFVSELPLNTNGKCDRPALLRWLGEPK
jgi:amino acid adenylation domain-containing protein